MLEVFFFILGLVNSIFLIFIFLIRKRNMGLIRRVGWVYFLLAIPAIYGIFLVIQEQNTARYTIFLGIFLAFLFVEWLFDYVLKVNFQENLKQNWRWANIHICLNYLVGMTSSIVNCGS
jgi:uncharacterized protein with PQ loop repeat